MDSLEIEITTDSQLVTELTDELERFCCRSWRRHRQRLRPPRDRGPGADGDRVRKRIRPGGDDRLLIAAGCASTGTATDPLDTVAITCCRASSARR